MTPSLCASATGAMLKAPDLDVNLTDVLGSSSHRPSHFGLMGLPPMLWLTWLSLADRKDDLTLAGLTGMLCSPHSSRTNRFLEPTLVAKALFLEDRFISWLSWRTDCFMALLQGEPRFVSYPSPILALGLTLVWIRLESGMIWSREVLEILWTWEFWAMDVVLESLDWARPDYPDGSPFGNTGRFFFDKEDICPDYPAGSPLAEPGEFFFKKDI